MRHLRAPRAEQTLNRSVAVELWPPPNHARSCLIGAVPPPNSVGMYVLLTVIARCTGSIRDTGTIIILGIGLLRLVQRVCSFMVPAVLLISDSTSIEQ